MFPDNDSANDFWWVEISLLSLEMSISVGLSIYFQENRPSLY